MHVLNHQLRDALITFKKSSNLKFIRANFVQRIINFVMLLRCKIYVPTVTMMFVVTKCKTRVYLSPQTDFLVNDEGI